MNYENIAQRKIDLGQQSHFPVFAISFYNSLRRPKDLNSSFFQPIVFAFAPSQWGEIIYNGAFLFQFTSVNILKAISLKQLRVKRYLTKIFSVLAKINTFVCCNLLPVHLYYYLNRWVLLQAASHCKTIYPTENLTSMKLLQMSCRIKNKHLTSQKHEVVFQF